ncbi:hypothetical protein MTR67_050893 [Solanum verrucosum]|uniref:Uncharacterized protein n=1 Tax=Solanum verrucosum TaxID=315347 RepID=A0AAF0V6A2_SOLVR|nr:hypothetical protein MTR67_050893 [Solanum verrucosum]
MPSNKVSWMRY